MTRPTAAPAAKRGRGRPRVGDSQLPPLTVPRALRDALEARAQTLGVTVAQAHRQALTVALLGAWSSPIQGARAAQPCVVCGGYPEDHRLTSHAWTGDDSR